MDATTRPKRSTRTRRQERVEARVTPEQKELFQKAAALRGRSLTDFIVTSAQEAAEDVIRTHQVISLSAEDSKRFVDALLDPPMPGRRFREAAARYLAAQET